MSANDNVIAQPRVTAGLLLGTVGVLAFSLTLPATRLAVRELNPWVVASGRAVGAGVLAVAYLSAIGAARPTARQLGRLVIVACGVVAGFPLLSSLALTEQTAAHGAVVVAVLPAATAVFAVLRAGERPSRLFWLAAVASLASVLVFVAVSGGLHGGVHPADLLLLAAAMAGGLGYAEGGALSRELDGPRTICWALVVSLPVTVPACTVLAVTQGLSGATGSAWLGFAYVTIVSMFLGFFPWYAGLARGGVAKVAQVQSLQPVLTLLWSALLLGEQVTALSLLAAVIVLCCVFLTQKTR
jgi:drug/metabolite transporter (DMT)-like permease